MNILGNTIYGNPAADICIIRMLGEHEKNLIEEEIKLIADSCSHDQWCIITVVVDDWNHELTPWAVEVPKPEQSFGCGADQKLKDVEKIIAEFENMYPNSDRRYAIAGYSLAGLFALWSSYQTKSFEGVVACSPSVWYPGWTEYAGSHDTYASCVYLSLGKKEHKTRNVLMSKVLDAIKTQHTLLEDQDINTVLEMNEGNHFADVTKRMVQGICWILGSI